MSCVSNATKRYKIKLVDIIKHNSEAYSFDFESQEINNWSEGDNSKLHVSYDEKEVGKKFSYATLPWESKIRFTTRIKTDRSKYKDSLYDLYIGDMIEISEPRGDFRLKRQDRPIVLLSNGVGIAANRSLIKSFERDGHGIPEMIQINVDAKGMIYKEEFDRLMSRKSNFKSFYESHRKDYYRRLDHELQELLVASDEEPLVYIVGSDGFVKENVSHLISVGFTQDDIITDSHISGTSACDCGPEDACGCGGNLVQIMTPNQLKLNNKKILQVKKNLKKVFFI